MTNNPSSSTMRGSRRPTTQDDVQPWRIIVFFEFVRVRLDVGIGLVDVEWQRYAFIEV